MVVTRPELPGPKVRTVSWSGWRCLNPTSKLGRTPVGDFGISSSTMDIWFGGSTCSVYIQDPGGSRSGRRPWGPKSRRDLKPRTSVLSGTDGFGPTNVGEKSEIRVRSWSSIGDRSLCSVLGHLYPRPGRVTV